MKRHRLQPLYRWIAIVPNTGRNDSSRPRIHPNYGSALGERALPQRDFLEQCIEGRGVLPPRQVRRNLLQDVLG